MSERTKQQIIKYKIDISRLMTGRKESMYVSEVISIPITTQNTLLNPKPIKFRSDLGFNQINLIPKKIISCNITIESIFCRKTRAAVLENERVRINMYLI